jgi:hypothetical protein
MRSVSTLSMSMDVRPPESGRDAIVDDIVARTGIDEPMIDRLVRNFYGRTRLDPLIGPVFKEKVHDWEAHFARMCAFWSSVALMSGRYHGQPMAAHLPRRSTHRISTLARDFCRSGSRCLSAGGGGSFPRQGASHCRQPRTECGIPEKRDQAKTEATGVHLSTRSCCRGKAVRHHCFYGCPHRTLKEMRE